MPSARRHSYDLNVKLKIVAEAEAVNNNREIDLEYGIQNPWREMTQPATCPVFWWAADNKMCIHRTLPTEGPELDIILTSKCCLASM